MDFGDKSWIILMTVNDALFDFYENWWWFYERLMLRQRVVVIAEDDLVADKLRNSLQASSGSLLAIERSNLTSDKAARFGSRAFKIMMSSRPTHLLRHLRQGRNVLFTDVDTVWLRDPFTYVQGAYDIWSPDDASSMSDRDQVQGCDHRTCGVLEFEDMPTFGAGFLAIKSSARTITFVENWERALLSGEPKVNQGLFNLEAQKSRGVKFATLPKMLFPNGELYFNRFIEEERKQVAVVHNNFLKGPNKKRQRFHIHSLWFPAEKDAEEKHYRRDNLLRVVTGGHK
eukprot:gene8366-9945_t